MMEIFDLPQLSSASVVTKKLPKIILFPAFN